MRRPAAGLFLDVGATHAGVAQARQRHGESAARPMPLDRYDQYRAQLWRRLCWVGQMKTTYLEYPSARLEATRLLSLVAQADHIWVQEGMC